MSLQVSQADSGIRPTRMSNGTPGSPGISEGRLETCGPDEHLQHAICTPAAARGGERRGERRHGEAHRLRERLGGPGVYR